MSILSVYFFPLGKTSSPRSLKIPWAVFPLTIEKSLSTKTDFNSSNLTSYISSNLIISSLSCARFLLSLIALEKSFLLITTPCKEGEAFREASLTSPALSPKIALRSFSSGVGSLSPLGVILPINISPGLISAPTRIIPFSSRSFVASSETLGISLVNSSLPSLVSLTSREYSSM